MMRLMFCLLMLPFFSFSQNLLVNGSFEEENYCIEYNVNCAPEGWIYTVPSFIYYFKDARLAHTGNHFIALVAGHSSKPYYRTFVRSRLLCGLKKGNTYQLQFYIKSKHSILDSIGIYFTNYDFLFEKKVYRKIDPTLYLANAVAHPVKNDTAWQLVKIDYTATGAETFITLGNFKKGDVTGTTGIDREKNFFVLIDDISLTPKNKSEKLCSDWQQTLAEIYSQDERHEYLDRLIKHKRTLPQEVITSTTTIIQKVDTIILPDILFESGKAALSKNSFRVLDEIAKTSKGKIIDSLVVEGHTDNVGTLLKNQKLSLERATVVMDYLNSIIQAENKRLRGWADEKPVATNNTAEGRQKNRRVEIYIYVSE